MSENDTDRHFTIHEIREKLAVSSTLLNEVKDMLGYTTVRYFSADQVEKIKKLLKQVNHAWRPLTEENLHILKRDEVECVFMQKKGHSRMYFMKKWPQSTNGWFYKVLNKA